MTELATAQIEIEQNQEVYGRSLYGLRQLGRVAVEGSVDTHELMVTQERAWNDFYTGTEENLTTDPEFGEKLVFDPIKDWKVVDGRVVSEDGKSMSELVKKGWAASKLASETDQRMQVQATRDEGDVMVAGWVDNLEAGEMLSVVSMDPKDAIKSDRNFWEGKMAYREGMAVVQTYYKTENSVITGTHAIKRSSKGAMSVALREHGLDIDSDLDDSLWTRYPVRQRATIDEALDFGPSLRSRHRELIGDTSEEFSVSDFMKQNKLLVGEYFRSYILPLAEATHTKQNNRPMQQLAQAILENSGALKAELRQSLVRVANSNKFTDDDSRAMEGMIRYALVEDLRKKLPEFMKKDVQKVTRFNYYYDDSFVPSAINNYHNVQQAYEQNFHFRLAKNIDTGAKANRSYGGCAPGSVSNEGSGPDMLVVPGNQDVFGGNGNEIDSSKEEDEYGSLEFECTKGHKNRRPKGKLIPKCTTCDEDVLCG